MNPTIDSTALRFTTWRLAPLSWLLVIACIAVLADSTPTKFKPHTVAAKDLDEWKTVIIGQLGLPLISATEIEATVVEDPGPYDIPTGDYLLKVEKVGETKLKEPILMSFWARPFHNITVAGSRTALDERLEELKQVTLERDSRKMVSPDDPLFYPKIRTTQDALAFKERYVGSRHRLVVHERATFDGVPMNLPGDAGGWGSGLSGPASRTFTLVVVAERKL